MTDMGYYRRRIKLHLNPQAFGHDMEMIGGHLPYAGILTFLRQLHTRELTGVDVAFLGLRWDGMPMNRSGQRFGPQAKSCVGRTTALVTLATSTQCGMRPE
jgi:hypothetical protein